MASDYLPGSDAEFTTWAQNFMTTLSMNAAGLGVDAATITAMGVAHNNWKTIYAAHVTGQADARSKREAKDAERRSFESAIRALVAQLQASPDVDNNERQALGIRVRDTKPTPQSMAMSRPVGMVDTKHRLTHVISFVDEGTPTKKARPSGVTACQIWYKVGDAPAGPNDVTYLATDSCTPYMMEFDQSDAGKMAHYMLRWVGSKGQCGPWSETVSATIPG